MQACCEHERAILLVEVLVEVQARRRAREQARERRLAHHERLAPKIIAIEFDQVEGIEEHRRVMAPVSDAIEGRDPILTAGHRLPIDDTGARAQPCQCLDDERKALGQVIAGAAVELHPLAVFAGDHPKTVVLDLVQPAVAGRRTRGR